MAGALAGWTAQTVIFPPDVIKTNYIIIQRRLGTNNVSMQQVIKGLIAREGALCFYKGYFVSCTAASVYVSIRQVTHDSLLARYRDKLTS